MLDQFGRTLECVVRDLSPLGARLALRVPRGLPSKFQLMFEADESVRQCRAIWRNETHVGLAFLSVPGGHGAAVATKRGGRAAPQGGSSVHAWQGER